MVKLIIFFLALFCITLIKAQEPENSNQFSVDIGFRNVFSTIWRGQTSKEFSNKASDGYSIYADYAWQFPHKPGKIATSYFAVPIEFTSMFPNSSSYKSSSSWAYGWALRHEYNFGKTFNPFFGYGLLLNRLAISGTDGEIIGHNTRFDIGLNLNIRKRVLPYVKLQYSYTGYPQLNSSRSYHVQSVLLSAGVRL